jgi:hypothetical protein
LLDANSIIASHEQEEEEERQKKRASGGDARFCGFPGPIAGDSVLGIGDQTWLRHRVFAILIGL